MSSSSRSCLASESMASSCIAALRGSGQLLLQEPAGAHEAGADGAFGNVENCRDLAGIQFVDGGESQGLAEFFRQSVDHAVDGGVLVGGDGILLGIGSSRGRVVIWFGIGSLRSLWALNPYAVDGNPPGGAREKGSLVVHSSPRTVAVELQEDLLCGVFGIMAVAQGGVDNSEDK